MSADARQDGALTRRELETIGLVADGLTNGQIAAQLWISAGTVRHHHENAYAKLGVHEDGRGSHGASLTLVRGGAAERRLRRVQGTVTETRCTALFS